MKGACSIEARKKYTVALAVFTTLLCTFISGWILRVCYDKNAAEEKLRELQIAVKCRIGCMGKNKSECGHIQSFCASKGFRDRRFYALPVACVRNSTFLRTLRQIITKIYHEEDADFLLDASGPQKNYITQARDAHYKPSRVIIQWFPTRHQTNGDSSTWNGVTGFERHSATFTVSSGSPDTFSNGAIVVPESGLYYVYGKLTFSCAVSDGETKHITVEVTAEEPSDDSLYHVMCDKQQASCIRTGDLTTSYQGGLFRLARGNELRIRYKASGNVHLSTALNFPFKSYFGMYRVGMV